MVRIARKQAKEVIETYLARYPNATSSEIGKALGVSKQRAHMLLKLLRIKASNQLTESELEILHLIAKGDSNKQIAETLNLTEQTIKNHITVILAKLNANNRAHAVAIAIQRGLILLDDVESARSTSKYLSPP